MKNMCFENLFSKDIYFPFRTLVLKLMTLLQNANSPSLFQGDKPKFTDSWNIAALSPESAVFLNLSSNSSLILHQHLNGEKIHHKSASD